LKIHFICQKENAKNDFESCISRYAQADWFNSDVHVVLGGDGSVLDDLHDQVKKDASIPIFALNYGKVGYLTNDKDWQDLPERILRAEKVMVPPLQVETTLAASGQRVKAYAFNEVSFFRGPSMQALDLDLLINDSRYNIFGDGAMIATPMGANAYLKSAGGPQMPKGQNMLAIHSNNSAEPFSAVVPADTVIAVASRQNQKRPARIECDSKLAIDHISRAIVRQATHKTQTLLFDGVKKNILVNRLRMR
jgi:NAD+ kinase